MMESLTNGDKNGNKTQYLVQWGKVRTLVCFYCCMNLQVPVNPVHIVSFSGVIGSY